jgi:hypothetical protein
LTALNSNLGKHRLTLAPQKLLIGILQHPGFLFDLIRDCFRRALFFIMTVT